LWYCDCEILDSTGAPWKSYPGPGNQCNNRKAKELKDFKKDIFPASTGSTVPGSEQKYAATLWYDIGYLWKFSMWPRFLYRINNNNKKYKYSKNSNNLVACLNKRNNNTYKVDLTFLNVRKRMFMIDKYVYGGRRLR
jgi:hypothetical protein